MLLEAGALTERVVFEVAEGKGVWLSQDGSVLHSADTYCAAVLSFSFAGCLGHPEHFVSPTRIYASQG